MSTSSFFGLGFLLTLPLLIAQWLGILGLGKRERDTAWKCMLVGACCSSLGTVSQFLFYATMFFGRWSEMRISGFVISLLTGLGTLLFFIGFAIHGQKGSVSQTRITELEAIATAQAEELNRLRMPSIQP